jgi:hypothetical protein
MTNDIDVIARAAAAATTISFDDAVRKAYSSNGNLKRYLDSFSHANGTSLFDKRVWEFRYKMQYEEPRVKVIGSKGNGDDITLLVTWNKEG